MDEQNVDELKNYYMKRPPESFSSKEISKMSDEDILDMDYFLNE